VIKFVQEVENCDFVSAVKKIEEITGEKYFEVKDQKGEKKITAAEVEEMIRECYSFITLRDTEEVLFYEGNMWHFGGETKIKEETERIMKELGRKESVTVSFVNEVIGHIQRETYIDRSILNRESRKINLLNGVYDLEKRELLPSSASYYFTYCIPVFYDTNKTCDRITRFLKEILDENDVEIVLEFIGYCMIPEQKLHKAVMFLGNGSNGKSTLIELIRNFLGTKNTTSHSLQALLETRFATADLYGRLANLYADISADALRTTGIFKVLTGGDMLMAEKKFMSHFQFLNTAKLIFSANQLPLVYDESDAFFRRWILINFPNTFDDNHRDPNLLQKLIDPNELSGLLNVVIAKLIRLLERGSFSDSKITADLRREYEEKSNPILSFARNRIEEARDMFSTKEEIYSAYVEFCREKKMPIVDKSVFGRKFPKYVIVRSSRRMVFGKQVTCWDGIVLKKKDEEDGGKDEA